MRAQPPQVGVVVLNWQGEAETRRCLAALAHQTEVALDVLVVDNGSGQGEAERLQALAPTLALAENRGFAAGMNAGAAALLGRGCSHLLLLNNDCELAPGAIAAMLAAGADVAVPTLWRGRPPARTRCWYAGGRVGGFSLEPRHDTRPLPPGAPPRPVAFATGCAWLVTAAAWQRLGGFDEGLFLYHEDVDASLRARAAGLSLVWVPGAEGWHAVGAATGSGTRKAPIVDYYDTRNGLLMIRRHGRGTRRLLALAWWGLVRVPRKVVRILATAGPARRKALVAVRDGVRDGWRGKLGRR